MDRIRKRRGETVEVIEKKRLARKWKEKKKREAKGLRNPPKKKKKA